MQGRSGSIHPTAIIDPGASLADDVTVGPYAVIGAQVSVGPGCTLANHVTIVGPTRIGRNNRFFPYASIGQDPQDKKYTGSGQSALEIGDENTFREFVTVNRGTEGGGGVTRIAHRNWIMAYCHIAHDCQVGSDTVFANSATLGGHVTVQDGVILGGFTAVHQFCTVGELTITGGHTMVAQDVTPFVIATGNRAQLFGVNKIGLQRHNFSEADMDAVHRAYKLFFRSKLNANDALAAIDAELSASAPVQRFVAFVKHSTRGICR
ncbi:MAG: acyl-ACP--UDP-N-acetylglucosamine O-acyltransferase [Candidatus Lambdaproteobacteria bacterium]|nr:acyl-ACP--UDP-N-acetylglucosamine O-acyltransferase [Candidatus Lambdaproteobacteria bacterium]